MAKVVVAKADTYDEQVFELAIKELLDEVGGMFQFIKRNDKV
ncbi:hypothetical protein [Pelosinus baikalensis]|nr:hypothetical protein [Pelosinus baikalensis]